MEGGGGGSPAASVERGLWGEVAGTGTGTGTGTTVSTSVTTAAAAAGVGTCLTGRATKREMMRGEVG